MPYSIPNPRSLRGVGPCGPSGPEAKIQKFPSPVLPVSLSPHPPLLLFSDLPTFSSSHLLSFHLPHPCRALVPFVWNDGGSPSLSLTFSPPSHLPNFPPSIFPPSLRGVGPKGRKLQSFLRLATDTHRQTQTVKPFIKF
jgi:hypothetical protein